MTPTQNHFPEMRTYVVTHLHRVYDGDTITPATRSGGTIDSDSGLVTIPTTRTRTGART